MRRKSRSLLPVPRRGSAAKDFDHEDLDAGGDGWRDEAVDAREHAAAMEAKRIVPTSMLVFRP